MVTSVVPAAVTNITLQTASCLMKNQSTLDNMGGTGHDPKRFHVRVCVAIMGNVKMIS
jgi:hypothetical protein